MFGSPLRHLGLRSFSQLSDRRNAPPPNSETTKMCEQLLCYDVQGNVMGVDREGRKGQGGSIATPRNQRVGCFGMSLKQKSSICPSIWERHPRKGGELRGAEMGPLYSDSHLDSNPTLRIRSFAG